MTSVIYKILSREQWKQSIAADRLVWLPLDEADGLIHFSTKRQLPTTLRKHFAGQDGLLVLEVPVQGLPADVARHLKWEKNTPDGDAYPHLYTDLPTDYVRRIYVVEPNDDGIHSVPDLI